MPTAYLAASLRRVRRRLSVWLRSSRFC